MAIRAQLAAGGTHDDLFYRPTVLADVPTHTPAFADEVFGPVAPVTTFSPLDQAVAIANDCQYGLPLGILSNNAMRALELAEPIPTGLVRINDQTVADEAVIPFGGTGASGTGARIGGVAANLDAFTETQWLTAQSTLTIYPF